LLLYLRPDDEQRGSRLVLPPQNVGRSERLVVEVWIVAIRERSVPAEVIGIAAVDQLLEPRVARARHERLRIELQRERGAEAVIHAPRDTDRRLIETREDVMVAGVGDLRDPLIIIAVVLELNTSRQVEGRQRPQRHLWTETAERRPQA